MPQFLFIHHGGKAPETREEGEKAMAAWGAWMAGMGSALVEGGNPVGKSSTVSASSVTDDGGANPVSGYSIIEAADHGDANEIAKGCPMVADGSGSVEVAEIHKM